MKVLSLYWYNWPNLHSNNKFVYSLSIIFIWRHAYILFLPDIVGEQSLWIKGTLGMMWSLWCIANKDKDIWYGKNFLEHTQHFDGRLHDHGSESDMLSVTSSSEIQVRGALSLINKCFFFFFERWLFSSQIT